MRKLRAGHRFARMYGKRRHHFAPLSALPAVASVKCQAAAPRSRTDTATAPLPTGGITRGQRGLDLRCLCAFGLERNTEIRRDTDRTTELADRRMKHEMTLSAISGLYGQGTLPWHSKSDPNCQRDDCFLQEPRRA
jgi:hypothetical protein